MNDIREYDVNCIKLLIKLINSLPNEKCCNACRIYRTMKLNKTQEDISKELNCSQENISAFENGRNGNPLILVWYIENGLLNEYSINELLGC